VSRRDGRTILKLILALVSAALLVAVGVFAWAKLAPRRVPAGQPPLTLLDAASLLAFRDAFNAPGDQVRVLVMLSPT